MTMYDIDEIRAEMARIDKHHGDDREVWDSMAEYLVEELLRTLGFAEIAEWWSNPPSW
jgi:hypothetical protein